MKKTMNEIMNDYETKARKREAVMLKEAEEAMNEIESGQVKKRPTVEQLVELREAAQYLASAAEMLEDTIKEKELDLDQLENDKELITNRSRRAAQAIEDILEEY